MGLWGGERAGSGTAVKNWGFPSPFIKPTKVLMAAPQGRRSVIASERPSARASSCGQAAAPSRRRAAACRPAAR